MKYAAALVLVVLVGQLEPARCTGVQVPITEKQERLDQFANAVAKYTKKCRDKWEKLDYDAAFKTCNRAAGMGVNSAQYSLGFMYDNGYGVSEDDVRAFMWLSLAAAQGNEKAEKAEGELRESMTPE